MRSCHGGGTRPRQEGRRGSSARAAPDTRGDARLVLETTLAHQSPDVVEIPRPARLAGYLRSRYSTEGTDQDAEWVLDAAEKAADEENEVAISGRDSQSGVPKITYLSAREVQLAIRT